MISHLAAKHRRHSSAHTAAQRAAIYDEPVTLEVWNLDTEPFIPPPPSSQLIPELPVYRGARSSGAAKAADIAFEGDESAFIQA